MANQTSNERALSIVEKTVVSARGKVSPPDLAASTGLALDEVKDALERLIELYEARVTVNPENASLLFVFPYPLRKRGTKSFRELLDIFLVGLWRVFKAVYKAAIGVVLIAYTIIFVVIIIAAASQGGNRRRDDDDGPGGLIGSIFNTIFSAMRFAAWNQMYFYAVDPYSGIRYRTTEKPKEGKNFIRAVFDFVFGPERPQKDHLADAREAAAFIRQNNAKLTSGHIIALAGYDYSGAEEKMAEYASRYKGELFVSEEGLVVGEYQDLLRREDVVLKDAKVEWYWDEVEAPYVLTGNSSGRNVAIAAMNGFNLIAAATVGSQYEGLLFFALCGFPVAFSVLFYLIPLARIPYVRRKEEERKYKVIRKKLIGVISAYPGRNFSFSDLMTLATINAQDSALVKTVLEKLVPELEGELNISPDGTPSYSFPRYSRELRIR